MTNQIEVVRAGDVDGTHVGRPVAVPVRGMDGTVLVFGELSEYGAKEDDCIEIVIFHTHSKTTGSLVVGADTELSFIKFVPQQVVGQRYDHEKGEGDVKEES